MIIVQTPLRISFFGGGTDFPDFFEEEGGCALTTAIDKYIFVIIKKRFDTKLRVGYTRTEMVDDLDEIQHELIRESLRLTGIHSGVEIATMGDIPSQGSGLGSSSTVTVGALHAMYSYQGELVTAETLAQQACHIEIDRLQSPIGIQDQYIAAYGGFRFFEFKREGGIEKELILLSAAEHRHLEQSTLSFFTGLTRQSGHILQEQKENIGAKRRVLGEMRAIAYEARGALAQGDLDQIGVLLAQSWQLKKQLASRISNPEIDEMYAAACRAGAIGGKVSGAGGGGFLLLYCPPERQPAVRYALRHLQELPFRFEPDGSKVIFNQQR